MPFVPDIPVFEMSPIMLSLKQSQFPKCVRSNAPLPNCCEIVFPQTK